MTKYKVIVLGVQGANNKVYTPDTETKHGKGIVSADMFPEGNAEKMVVERKLQKIEEKLSDDMFLEGNAEKMVVEDEHREIEEKLSFKKPKKTE